MHGPDQGQVVRAAEEIYRAASLSADEAIAPTLLTDEVIRKIDDHHAMMINRTRSGMLVLGGDTLYTLEVTPAVYVVLAANEAEKASPIRIVGLGADGAVGRLRLAGSDAEIEAAVQAVHRALEGLPGRKVAPDRGGAL